MQKQPERTCVVCRKKGTKDNFIKVVKNKSGEFLIEDGMRLDGRGAYICKNEDCITKSKKTKAFARVFKTNVPLELYDKLLEKYGNCKN